MHSNKVFQFRKIRTRKRNAKKSIKTVKIGIQPFLESGIHCAGIRNPVPGIRNPQRGIQNPRMSWIPLHGKVIGVAIMMKLKSNSARLRTKSLGIERFCFFLLP